MKVLCVGRFVLECPSNQLHSYMSSQSLGGRDRGRDPAASASGGDGGWRTLGHRVTSSFTAYRSHSSATRHATSLVQPGTLCVWLIHSSPSSVRHHATDLAWLMGFHQDWNSLRNASIECNWVSSYSHLVISINLPGGGGNVPCTFSSIAQKRKGIELRNFRNPFLHQFYTCWPKENFASYVMFCHLR